MTIPVLDWIINLEICNMFRLSGSFPFINKILVESRESLIVQLTTNRTIIKIKQITNYLILPGYFHFYSEPDLLLGLRKFGHAWDLFETTCRYKLCRMFRILTTFSSNATHPTFPNFCNRIAYIYRTNNSAELNQNYGWKSKPINKTFFVSSEKYRYSSLNFS